MHTCISSHGLKRCWRSCPRWVNAGNKKHTQHAPPSKTECDYLNGWIEKRSHTQKSHPKVVNPRDTAGERRRRRTTAAAAATTTTTITTDRLVGRVAKASTSRAKDPGFDSRLRCHWLTALPGARHYRVCTGTGWPGVSILRLGEVEGLICNFYLSVAARKLVWADPSLRYTSMLQRHRASTAFVHRTRFCVVFVTVPQAASAIFISFSLNLRQVVIFFFFFFFCVPQLYLWGSPLLGEIFAYVTVL